MENQRAIENSTKDGLNKAQALAAVKTKACDGDLIVVATMQRGPLIAAGSTMSATTFLC